MLPFGIACPFLLQIRAPRRIFCWIRAACGQFFVYDSPLVLDMDDWGMAFGNKVILSDVQLHLLPRTITALVGPVGAGKSSLARSLAGTHDKNAAYQSWGRVVYGGLPLAEGRRPRLAHQQARLMLASVQDAILEFKRFDGSLTPGERRGWCEAFLDRMGFSELKSQLSATTLSLAKVQQRAVAILREAVAEPALLMVDEPAKGLDDYDSYLVVDLLKRIAQECSVLWITHNQRLARKAAHQVALLAGGRIQEVTSAERFFATPDSQAGEQFLQTGTCTVQQPVKSVDEWRARLARKGTAYSASAEKLAANASGVHGLGWLVDGQLAGVEGDADVDLHALQQCGVTVLISLTDKDVDQAALSRHHMRNVHLPVHDRQPPTVPQLRMLMLKMQGLLQRGEVVAVHCRAGLGCTGSVLAAWAIFEGATAGDALQRVRHINPNYVQSPPQESVLLAYAESLQRLRA